MSKLGEKMRRVAQGGASSLGFRPHTSKSPLPPLLLIALLEGADAEGIRDAVARGADAIVVAPPEPIDEAQAKAALEAAQEVPLGLLKEEASKADAERWRQLGGDFLALAAARSAAAVLLDEEPAKLLLTELGLSDSLAQALDPLPVEGLWVAPEGASDLLIGQAIALRRLADLSSKPLFLEFPSTWAPTEVESLPDCGVMGVVVKPEEGSSGRLEGLRQAIDALPGPSQRSRRRATALLPPSPTATELEEEFP